MSTTLPVSGGGRHYIVVRYGFWSLNAIDRKLSLIAVTCVIVSKTAALVPKITTHRKTNSLDYTVNVSWYQLRDPNQFRKLQLSRKAPNNFKVFLKFIILLFSVSEFFRRLLKLSREEFHMMFKRTYGMIYEQHSYVFEQLFEQLER